MRGALAPVAAATSSHQGLPVGCLWFHTSPVRGPGREGKEITSGRRDARGLPFSVVIQARAMQPGVSTHGKQSGPIALCGYGMTLALRHHVQLLEGEGRVGSRASPQLQRTPFSNGDGPLEDLFPYLRNPVSATLLRRSSSPLEVEAPSAGPSAFTTFAAGQVVTMPQTR